ncbi:pyruvate dehydrogenase (acetyl-transferring) E1 component subunit alpha [Candidatus Micrarchaeota archaeon]|nr:MAG: pyruvate dehydrogenase (acetyl-transferring) E1 component subunit alpha [Candidatus Micrarchaeota archaeon]
MPRKKIYEGSVEYLQILDEKGNVDKELEPQLSNEDLDKMYRFMITTRTFDRKVLSLQRQGRAFTYAPVEGKEASQTGTAYALKKTDRVFPSYRDHGVYLTRGLSLKQMFLMWMGTEEGGRMPEDSGDFPFAIPIASQIPHAVGAAWAAKIQKQDKVCAVYFGDGATSEGDFHEGINFAGVNKAPVVLVCQNNKYAISVPRALQTAAETIAQKALAYGFEGIQVDGNDVLAVYSAMKSAVEKARKGEGPTLIECLTYRFGPHTTSDDPSKYRSKEEEEEWRKKDPVVRFQLYLRSKGIWNEEYEKKVNEEAKQKVEKALEEAESSIKIDPTDIFKYVYAEMPEPLREEMEYLKRIGEEKKEAHGEQNG